jgi:WhiB family transcriptional regulator, redox-sensing transcriptional regulator
MKPLGRSEITAAKKSNPYFTTRMRVVNQPNDWDKRACLSVGINVFFNQEHEPPQAWRKRQRKALAVCQACVLIDWCRFEALSMRDVNGVRGGLTGQQRRKLVAGQENAQVSS